MEATRAAAAGRDHRLWCLPGGGCHGGCVGGGRRYSALGALAGGLAVLLLAMGCEDGGTAAGQRESLTPTGTAAPSAASSSATTTAVPGLTRTGAVTASFDPETGPGVFVGAFGYVSTGVDHVGLSFRGGPPPCVARYVDPPVTDTVGRRVAVAGSAFVRIRCRQVTDIDFESIGVPPQARLRLGADRFRVPAAENVVEVVRTGYRGSVLTLVVGLRHVAPMTGGMIQAGGKRHLEFIFGH